MRRKERHVLQGALVAMLIAVGLDLLRQYLESRKAGKPLSWKNYDGWRTVGWAAGGAVAGGLAGYGVYEFKVAQERTLPFSPNRHLRHVLNSRTLKRNSSLYQSFKTFGTDLIAFLASALGDRLAGKPIWTGSFHRGTALVDSDADVLVPFKKTATSLDAMADVLYETLKKQYPDENVRVARHRKGVYLEIRRGGEMMYFDVVPGRESGCYKQDNTIQLYKQADGIWEDGKRSKTNVALHREYLRGKPEARQVAALLKVWHDALGYEVNSTLIEQVTARSYDRGLIGSHQSLSENLLVGMENLGRKIKTKRLADIANSNDNLLQKLRESNRHQIADRLFKDCTSIKSNPHYLAEVFNIQQP